MKAAQIIEYLATNDIDGLREAARAEIRAAEDKATRGGEVLRREKAILKYLSKASKNIYNSHELGTAKRDGGQLLFANGFSCYALDNVHSEAIPAPERPADFFPADKIIQDTARAADGEAVQLPAARIRELHAAAKAQARAHGTTLAKGKQWLLVELGGKLFNINYLVEVLDILGNNVTYTPNSKKTAPGYFSAEGVGAAVVLPIRPGKKVNEAREGVPVPEVLAE